MFTFVIAFIMFVNALVAEPVSYTTPQGHDVTIYEDVPATVVQVDACDGYDVVTVRTDDGNLWAFEDDKPDFWAVGDSASCEFNVCRTCNDVELSNVEK